MRQGMTMPALVTELERQKNVREDYLVDTRQMRMDTSGRLHWPNPANPQGMPMSIRPTPHAHGQIADRCKIPMQYYRRMRAEEPTLFSQTVNTWLRRQEERRMLRTLADQDGNQFLRAFLSDRYRRVNNDDVFFAAYPILKEVPDVRFESQAVTDQRLYIKAFVPSITARVTVGDVCEAGVVISNGEIGNGAIEVAQMVKILSCENGMKITLPGGRKTHIGARLSGDEETSRLLSDEAQQAEKKATLLAIRDLVKVALDEGAFQHTVARMRTITEQRIEGDPVKAVEKLSQKAQIVDEERAGIMRELIEGGDASRFGMMQAVTAFARSETLTYDRASELEAVGGNVLMMPDREWVEIARAA